MRFQGKKALVTGAAGGIGKSLVRKLRAEGASVAITDITIGNVEAEAHFQGDLTAAQFCDELPSKARDALGGLDILINNAGIIRRGKITEATDDDFKSTMAVNIEAPFRLCRSTIPILAKNGGGSIVNIASCWGLNPGPDHPIYIMSKAALASFTQCLGRDHAYQNIRVNAVCPNEVNTPMIRSGFSIRGLNPEKAIKELNDTVPLGRIAEPDDISDVILFLASDEARYVCGSLVEVNGGKPVS
jgi:2-keto-3-deoxy-L-fuconate dehydrogenase